jgi:D-tyrosyl-tRNA(Tyr) deacylase
MLFPATEGRATRCRPTLKGSPPNRSAIVASTPRARSSSTRRVLTAAVSGAHTPVVTSGFGTERGDVGPQAIEILTPLTTAATLRTQRSACRCGARTHAHPIRGGLAPSSLPEHGGR